MPWQFCEIIKSENIVVVNEIQLINFDSMATAVNNCAFVPLIRRKRLSGSVSKVGRIIDAHEIVAFAISIRSGHFAK